MTYPASYPNKNAPNAANIALFHTYQFTIIHVLFYRRVTTTPQILLVLRLTLSRTRTFCRMRKRLTLVFAIMANPVSKKRKVSTHLNRQFKRDKVNINHTVWYSNEVPLAEKR